MFFLLPITELPSPSFTIVKMHKHCFDGLSVRMLQVLTVSTPTHPMQTATYTFTSYSKSVGSPRKALRLKED